MPTLVVVKQFCTKRSDWSKQICQPIRRHEYKRERHTTSAAGPVPVEKFSDRMRLCHKYNGGWYYQIIALVHNPHHDPMLGQCWSTVYDAGPTLIQHCVSCLLRSSICSSCDGNEGASQREMIPANKTHKPSVVWTLGQRRWRWPNVNTTLGQCLFCKC